ncbi:MAG: MoaD/ThiS family protein [Bacillota bacterium]
MKLAVDEAGLYGVASAMASLTVWLHPAIHSYLQRIGALEERQGNTIAIKGLPEGTTVGDLLRRLGLPSGAVGVVIIDGQVVTSDSVLPAECTVHIYPAFEGG